MDNEKEFLISHGIKPSIQRIKVLRFLRNNPIHPTAEDVYKGIFQEIPTLSRTTIYNTLNYFAQKGIVRVVNISHNETRYDIITEEHIHFKCNVCGRVYDVFLDNCNIPEPGSSIDGHIVEEREVVLRGVCRICKTQKGGSDEIQV